MTDNNSWVFRTQRTLVGWHKIPVFGIFPAIPSAFIGVGQFFWGLGAGVMELATRPQKPTASDHIELGALVVGLSIANIITLGLSGWMINRWASGFDKVIFA